MFVAVAAIAGAVGIVFLVNSVYVYRKDRREQKMWAAAPGVVVGHAERPLPAGAPVFVPLVKFTTDKSAVVQFEDRVGHKPPRHKVGQSVRVLYDRIAPTQARIVAGPSWAAAAPYLIFGLIFLLLSAGLAWLSRQP